MKQLRRETQGRYTKNLLWKPEAQQLESNRGWWRGWWWWWWWWIVFVEWLTGKRHLFQPRPLSEILTNIDLWQVTSRVRSSTESELYAYIWWNSEASFYTTKVEQHHLTKQIEEIQHSLYIGNIVIGWEIVKHVIEIKETAIVVLKCKRLELQKWHPSFQELAGAFQ